MVANINLGSRALSKTNALAYLPGVSVAKKKSLIMLTPGVNVMKLILFIADDKA